MKYIQLLLAIILCFCSCGIDDNDSESFDELQIMSTVCINGVLHFSIVDHKKCFYTPVTVEGEIVRCDK